MNRIECWQIVINKCSQSLSKTSVGKVWENKKNTSNLVNLNADVFNNGDP